MLNVDKVAWGNMTAHIGVDDMANNLANTTRRACVTVIYMRNIIFIVVS